MQYIVPRWLLLPTCFRNEPVPEEYTKVGLSPLHARVIALFDTVKDEHRVCGMDNL